MIIWVPAIGIPFLRCPLILPDVLQNLRELELILTSFNFLYNFYCKIPGIAD
jgi:hypothetical protein